MFRDRLRAGLNAGVLAAAATTGAVVGLGLRHDRALEPFVAAGRSVLPAPEGLVPLTWLALTSGMVVHLVWMCVWGLVFVLFASRLSRAAAAVAALAFALLLGLVVWPRQPALLGALGSDVLSDVQRALALAAMAAALFAGARFARVSRTPSASEREFG